MRFKQYLNELANIETGQAITAHEPSEKMSTSVINPHVMMEINRRFIVEFNNRILTPHEGIQLIRKILHRYHLDMPALYEPDPEGDEDVLDLKQFGQPHGVNVYGDTNLGTEVINKEPDGYLYFIYYLDDNGTYEFYAEIVDEDGLEELMADIEEEEKEEI